MLVGILMNGYTPYLAAFWGITFCIIVGLVNPRNRLTLKDVFEGFVTGAKYALAIGAAAATVGIIIGVVTLTGVSFKVAFMVTSIASGWAAILLVAPELTTTIVGTLIFLPIALRPLLWKHGAPVGAN